MRTTVRFIRSPLLSLRTPEAYEEAFTSWDDEGDAATWDVVVADGLEK
jgi:hypothetical protein